MTVIITAEECTNETVKLLDAMRHLTPTQGLAVLGSATEELFSQVAENDGLSKNRLQMLVSSWMQTLEYAIDDRLDDDRLTDEELP